MDIIKKIALDFCKGMYDYNVEDGLWPKVFEYLLKHEDKLAFDRGAIHTLWTVNGGHLRRKIKNDDLILDVLLKCLPKYKGEGMVLYRGECAFLFKDNKIGFCWTQKKEVAEMFARGLNAIESGGVLLKAFAPQKAIITSPNEHSEKQMKEFEYSCNPRMLENIKVIRVYEKL